MIYVKRCYNNLFSWRVHVLNTSSVIYLENMMHNVNEFLSIKFTHVSTYIIYDNGAYFPNFSWFMLSKIVVYIT